VEKALLLELLPLLAKSESNQGSKAG
jgi:hypothetical protein